MLLCRGFGAAKDIFPPVEQSTAIQVLRAGVAEAAGPGGDLGSMQEVAKVLGQYLEQFAAPDFACAMVPIPPTPEVVYPGADGVERAWQDWGGAFVSVRATLDEIVESPTALVMLVQQTAETRHGVEVTQPSAMVFKFAAGGVERVEFHLDRDAALRASGIDPADFRPGRAT